MPGDLSDSAAGVRLYPLTKSSKPAVPIAGKYRLRISPFPTASTQVEPTFVLTQFNSVSLHRHIANTSRSTHSAAATSRSWPRSKRWHESWYQGTADASAAISRATEDRYDMV